jgi:hypothetical protein
MARQKLRSLTPSTLRPGESHLESDALCCAIVYRVGNVRTLGPHSATPSGATP